MDKVLDHKKQILKILWHFRRKEYGVDPQSLSLTFEDYVHLLKEMMANQIIENISIIPADDGYLESDCSTVIIKQKGYEMLEEEVPNIIMNDILDYLYKHRNKKPVQIAIIGRNLFIKHKPKYLSPYLNRLEEKKYIKPYTSNCYSITEDGIKYIINGYKEVDPYQESISRLAVSAEDINDSLRSISKTLEIILHSMGAQNQRILREQIRSSKLIEEYLELAKSNIPNKEDKIKDFFKNLRGDLAVALIIELSMFAIGL